MEHLPQNGYSVTDKLREIELNEYAYKDFREALKVKREALAELDYLDEMINDMNYMMFHQHLFGERNEFELTKLDNMYNSPGRDLLF